MHCIAHYVMHCALCDAGSDYMPGLIGLNNIKDTDYVNVVVQSLSRVPPAGANGARPWRPQRLIGPPASLRAQGAPAHPEAPPRSLRRAGAVRPASKRTSC